MTKVELLIRVVPERLNPAKFLFFSFRLERAAPFRRTNS